MIIGSADLRRGKVAKLANEMTIVIKDGFGKHSPTYTDENWDILAEVIRTTASLEKLRFPRGTAIALQNDKVIDALAKNRTIKSLNLWQAYGGDTAAKAVAAILKENTTIEMINLYGNNIKREGAKAIADALKENTSLQRLYIRLNNIDEGGGKQILNALQQIELHPASLALHFYSKQLVDTSNTSSCSLTTQV